MRQAGRLRGRVRGSIGNCNSWSWQTVRQAVGCGVDNIVATNLMLGLKDTNMRRALNSLIFLGSMMLTSGVLADQPVSKALGFQEPVTEGGVMGQNFHNHLLLPVITFITLFVLGLLLYCMVRFNHKANPVPSKTTHNTLVEVVWTVVPIIILIVFAVPSFKHLYALSTIPKPDVVIKATGHQWNWSYEYVDSGFEFSSVLMPEAETKAKKLPWLLETDNRLVVPAGKVVKMQVTAADVIHSWAMPSFFVKSDAVPGRLNETWFKVDKPGIYYGQCSELCGKDHAYMPIAVEVVTPAQYAAWLTTAKTKFASTAQTKQYALATSARAQQ
jgi:cytochrome c oxidase subunit II